ncbi:protein of unknown function [Nitrospira japonica]|uniref:DUF3015 domain-containing protein n=1 Tax=Nitrospira japonica TaxID=1325564 RepID=A0A1W1I6Q8_9BACT|nr:DUF3015 family protein [Nitrospira japonica]SLM48665.1 protein of unknown function [Nitrospira japonica]
MAVRRTELLGIAVVACGLFAGACTVTESVKGTLDNITDFTSSTTPGAWSQDGLLRAEHRQIIFATYNYESVKRDIARGEGEHLASLATLLGVAENRSQEFGLLAQARYTEVESPKTSPEEMLTSMRAIVRDHPELVLVADAR